ncbi:MAG: hypothetical protein LBF49_03090 [Puniceicoccales bacterium]|jgi:hypothetical protein|nr:hypothetical protein [Puniceicoccales bacterium]
MDTNTTVTFSTIPNDKRVSEFRDAGCEVYVFKRKEKGMNFVEGKMVEKTVERRIVAVKYPYVEGEDVYDPLYDTYDVYDSALEGKKFVPVRTMDERQVKALQNDPTFTHEGPAAEITTRDDTHDGVLEGEEEALRNNPIFITTGEYDTYDSASEDYGARFPQ